jgi:signal transduction histidine kinase
MIDNIQPATPIHIRFNEDSEKLRACGDVDRIGLVNLLGNSIKYAPASRKIKIKVDALKSEDVTLVNVKDECIGIPAEELKNIFSRFTG